MAGVPSATTAEEGEGRLTLDPREALRESFRPREVRVLFVGESAPASGRFVYQADSGLYRAMRDAFVAAFPDTAPEQFLQRFRDRGCWLVDLCARPVDDLPDTLRRERRRQGEAELARTLVALQPPVLVPLLVGIVPNVDRAVAAAGWSGERLDLPYPGRWASLRRGFLGLLVPAWRRWDASGALLPAASSTASPP